MVVVRVQNSLAWEALGLCDVLLSCSVSQMEVDPDTTTLTCFT